MTTVRIPTSTDPTVPLYVQTTILSGVEYQFSFEYNQKDGFWYFTLRNQDGVDLVSGLRCVEGWQLDRGLVSENLPPLSFFIYDLQRKYDVHPGLTDLGARFELLYTDFGEP